MAKIKYRKADTETVRASLSSDVFIEHLRAVRETECFAVVNRGSLWYDSLSDDQKQELAEYYRAWLDVTKTLKIPEKPSWLR